MRSGTVLHCTALHCTALHCTALYCTALHCTALHCTALHCTALHCTALHCTALHCTALHCTALHCTALHCIALQHARITNVVAYNSPDAPYLPLLYPVAGQLLEAGLEEEQVLCFLTGFAPTPASPPVSASTHHHAFLVYFSIPASPPAFTLALACILRNKELIAMDNSKQVSKSQNGFKKIIEIKLEH